MEKIVSRVQMAEILAAYMHSGQVDKAGAPYINHPIAVAQKVESDDEKIVALLHDTMEDTGLTFFTIQNLFGKEIADAVDCLTHRKGEPYLDYVRRAKTNKLSRTVKLADLEHNMDLSRLPSVTDKDMKRLEKYKTAREILLGTANINEAE